MRCLVCNENGVIVLCFNISQLSVKSHFSVDGPLLSVGPSAIRGFFVEGSRLDTEPSMI